MDRTDSDGTATVSDTPQVWNAQHSAERLASGIKVFTNLSWTGGLFGIAVFIFAAMSGTEITPGFILIVGLVTAYLLFPVILRLTKRLDLITVAGLLWLVPCIGVSAWIYGGYASAALPWLCAVPIFAFYYLRGVRLTLVLAATGLCFVFVSALHLSGHDASVPPDDLQYDIVYGLSFGLLLIYLSIASHAFRNAETVARRSLTIAMTDAQRHRLKAEAASAAKSHFLASVSHELRTPLNAIVGFSDFMRHTHLTPTTRIKTAEYAEDIHFSATHLLALINDVLDYSDVGFDAAKIVETPVDLRGVVDSALRLASFQAGAEALTIVKHVPRDLPLFMGDERRLKQIVINLLVNAIKFTPAGGRITIALQRNAQGGVDFVIADNGIGIPEQDLAQVIQPFFKSAPADASPRPGIGLGLAITAELVKLHDGTLSIESQVGQGTTVTCAFPPSRIAEGFTPENRILPAGP